MVDSVYITVGVVDSIHITVGVVDSVHITVGVVDRHMHARINDQCT